MILINSDCLKHLNTMPENTVDSLITDPPAGISFMGKEWDSAKGGRDRWIAWMTEVMRECLRVMKPGSHGLVWAIPRTSHWTATALEDAGFEVRDVITHLFGQGFPKSLDISKAIDKAAGADRKVVGLSTIGGGGASNSKGFKADKNKQSGGSYQQASDGKNGIPVTEPATDAAKQWSGWGTALKPASEHWILVRKPCAEKTVAANVLGWGVGGINVDGCRVASDSIYIPSSQGRFPANLVLSHSPYCTDDQCDIECAIEQLNGQATQEASRFFYCAKISSSERGEGNNHPTVKPQKLMRYLCRLITPPGGVILDPFMGSGSTGLAAKSEGFEFIGVEREPDYFEIAENRIKQ